MSKHSQRSAHNCDGHSFLPTTVTTTTTTVRHNGRKRWPCTTTVRHKQKTLLVLDPPLIHPQVLNTAKGTPPAARIQRTSRCSRISNSGRSLQDAMRPTRATTLCAHPTTAARSATEAKPKLLSVSLPSGFLSRSSAAIRWTRALLCLGSPATSRASASGVRDLARGGALPHAARPTLQTSCCGCPTAAMSQSIASRHARLQQHHEHISHAMVHQ